MYAMVSSLFSRCRSLHLALACLLPTVPCGWVLAQEVDYKVELPTQRLEMVVQSSRILTLESDIPRIMNNNPDFVRVVPLSPNQVQLSALKPGVTQVNLWDSHGKAHTVDVIVFRDPRPLEMILQTEFPKSAIRVRPIENSVILSGYVDRPDIIDNVVQIASDYYPNVINNINVGGVQQVNLTVKVMEVSRTKLRDLGFDWAAIFDNDFIIHGSSGLVNPRTSGPGGIISTGQETIRFGIVNNNDAFYGYIRALGEHQLLKILAEPNLVTVSGRPASFNEGGEFPILVPSGLGTTAVEFKEFGTRVDFVPIVQGNGNIRLEVRPQISEIDASRGVELNGITVPGLRKRFVDTAVEMRSGQTLALAGLIQNRVEVKKRGTPGLMDLPWAGSLFRNMNENVNEIELLVVVTPRLVSAMDASQVPPLGPGEFTATPNDKQYYGLGHIEVPRCCNDVKCQYPDAPQAGASGLPYGPMGPQGMPVMPGNYPSTDGSVGPMNAIPPTAGEGQALPGDSYQEIPAADAGTNATTPPAAEVTEQSGTSLQPELFGPTGYDDLN